MSRRLSSPCSFLAEENLKFEGGHAVLVGAPQAALQFLFLSIVNITVTDLVAGEATFVLKFVVEVMKHGESIHSRRLNGVPAQA
jgi:hypothetical protein